MSIRRIREMAEEDFHKARRIFSSEIPIDGEKITLKRKGKEHPIQKMIQKVRNILLDLGFDEVENLYIIKEDDVFKQYGHEAPVILDRCYYLAGLPRQDIGIDDDTIRALRKIKEDMNIKSLKSILRKYKEGKIESDDIVEVFMEKLELNSDDAVRVVDVLKDFILSSPIPTKTILRSHMTASWFHTLSSLQHRMRHPICLFSIGPRFRREQRIDATHLRVHYGASAVILDDNISLKEGMRICEEILKRIGFDKVEFKKKTATANYYAHDMEYEVYANNVEIADCGIYSPVALSNYSIEFPVFNVGFGIERIIMLMDKIDDVREVMYPQFYTDWKATDDEIAESIHIMNKPRTTIGKEIANAIVKTCERFKDEKGPCSFVAWEGEIHRRKIIVKIEEKEENVSLCGPATFNYIVVYEGGVFGIQKNEKFKRYFERGRVLFRYIDAIAQQAASSFESMDGEKDEVIVKVVKLPSHINISIEEHVRYAITKSRKKIDIRGPVFVKIVAEVVK